MRGAEISLPRHVVDAPLADITAIQYGHVDSACAVEHWVIVCRVVVTHHAADERGLAGLGVAAQEELEAGKRHGAVQQQVPVPPERLAFVDKVGDVQRLNGAQWQGLGDG